VQQRLARKPLASFPSVLASVRVQDQGYWSERGRGYGHGRFTVVTTREAESDEALARLTKLPMVRGIAPLNRLVLSPNINSEENLRAAAASVQADILLIYTFETVFGNKTTIPALGVITLGLFPNEEARVTSTASAALLDTRNGYVYALAEASAKTEQLANAWTSREAADEARVRAEKEAFSKLVGELERAWGGVVANYAPSSGTQPNAESRGASDPSATTIAPVANPPK
jgi:hypothetical protein